MAFKFAQIGQAKMLDVCKVRASFLCLHSLGRHISGLMQGSHIVYQHSTILYPEQLPLRVSLTCISRTLSLYSATIFVNSHTLSSKEGTSLASCSQKGYVLLMSDFGTD